MKERKRGDLKQVEYLKDRYNAFIREKFNLLDEIDLLKEAHKPFAHLSKTCQQITDELIRIDETKYQILLG